MQDRAEYRDVVGEVITELLTIRQRYLDAGVSAERIILDPGIGFAKTHDQNWQLLRHLSRFTDLGHRILLGVSRKDFSANCWPILKAHPDLLNSSTQPRHP